MSFPYKSGDHFFRERLITDGMRVMSSPTPTFTYIGDDIEYNRHGLRRKVHPRKMHYERHVFSSRKVPSTATSWEWKYDDF